MKPLDLSKTRRSSLPKVLRPLPSACSMVALAAFAVFSGMASAQSLESLYESAKGFDASYLSAKYQLQASQAKAQQARAGVLPTVGLSAEAFENRRNSSVNAIDDEFHNQNTRLSAVQPIYRPVNWLSLEQAEKSLLVAQAQFDQAEQALIVKTAQAYFDVLAAQDNLGFVQAQKKAVSEQLAAAKRNFEVGTATITDTREAQARFDLVTAQEIAAQNDLNVKKLALDQLVGQSGTQPWRVASGVELPALEPQSIDTWVMQAQGQHPVVRQASAGLEIAQLETRKAQAGHQPTLDLVAQYQMARAPSGMQTNSPNIKNNTSSVGVQFNLPLFAGFAVQNKIKETAALEEKARTDLEDAKRNLAQATRATYFGVLSGMSQVKALEAAEASSQSALEANQLGYQVGVRINIDVLNAQSQLFQTKASLAKARYDVLVGGLKLRQASGVLQSQDLKPINALLQP